VIRLLAGRLVFAVLAIWLVASLTFLIARLQPSDPARLVLGPHADNAALARARVRLCLDGPLLAQYRCYLGRLAHGDLGVSLRTRRPVAQLLAERARPTLELALLAVLLQLALGLPLGAWASRRRGLRGPLVEAMCVLLQAAPVIVVGPLLLYVFAYRIRLVPFGGHGLRQLILAAITLALSGIATCALALRAELSELAHQDFIRTAVAKGLSPRSVTVRHALPSALAPVLALVAVDLGSLMGGTLFVETIFGWPGLGREAARAVFTLDLPVLLGVTMLATAAVILANLLADALAILIDPRLRYAAQR
jgi:ABC-type dipeptide/oligopeptide/nickel transport system permease component